MKVFDGKIIQVKELAFEINEFRPEVIAHFDLKNLNSFVDFEYEADRENERLVIHCNVEVLYDVHFRPLRFLGAFVFQFIGFDQHFEEQGKIDEDLLLDFMKQSFLMASGMLVVKTQGFYLNLHPLPLPNQEFLIEKVRKMIELDSKAKTNQ